MFEYEDAPIPFSHSSSWDGQSRPHRSVSC